MFSAVSSELASKIVLSCNRLILVFWNILRKMFMFCGTLLNLYDLHVARMSSLYSVWYMNLLFWNTPAEQLFDVHVTLVFQRTLKTQQSKMQDPTKQTLYLHQYNVVKCKFYPLFCIQSEISVHCTLYIVFPHVSLIFFGPSNNYIEVSFYCVRNSEFLVLTHNIPGMIVSEKKQQK